MAQRVKVFNTKTDDLSLIPGTHIVEGENQLQNISYNLNTHSLCLSVSLSSKNNQSVSFSPPIRTISYLPPRQFCI